MLIVTMVLLLLWALSILILSPVSNLSLGRVDWFLSDWLLNWGLFFFLKVNGLNWLAYMWPLFLVSRN